MLQEEMKMLKKHTSPQEIGLADEGVLMNRLAKEFPEDRIEHVGKGGDEPLKLEKPKFEPLALPLK